MTTNKALAILGLNKSYTDEELKKTYRSLMILTHPDSVESHDYRYDASDINAAYEYLLKNKSYIKCDKSKPEKKSATAWNAAINKNAYCEREIYHTVEDYEGNIIGKAVIATGKYTWCEDEDFSLFLLSIYNCSKKIIIDSDEQLRCNRSDNIPLQGEIAYLLAQQYVDTSMILSMMDSIGEDIDGLKMYKLHGMLEMMDISVNLSEGEIVYPAGVRHHRLYVKNKTGVVGYVSFKDDRLYYGLIPLFERKAVRVKMVIHVVQHSKRSRKKSYDIEMAIKLLNEDKNHMIESINLQIENILRME